jgi:predicted lactoylglutathione lyase
MRSVFINLPVADTEASKAFYAALGFQHNPAFSDEQTTCIAISQHIYVMAMDRSRFQGFITGEIAPDGTTEVLNALSCESREEVDQLITKALDAGGRPWKPTMDMEGMYGGSFQDPDGHVWELMWMDPATAEAGDAKGSAVG